MQIIPAILVHSSEELKEKLEKLTPFFKYLQIDIADGTLSEDRTLEVDQVISVLNNYVQNGQIELKIDFDLIVSDYKNILEKLTQLDSKIVKNNLLLRPKTISTEDFEVVQKAGFTVGFAIDPNDSVETIRQQFDLNIVPAIQVLTVVPGAQGRPFLAEELKKIEQLRNAGYRNKVFLDGGITDKTLPTILNSQFRPDVLCVGSFFSKFENVEERKNILSSLLSDN